jgi:hypothetical protein
MLKKKWFTFNIVWAILADILIFMRVSDKYHQEEISIRTDLQ